MQKRQYHLTLIRKNDTSCRPPQIDLIRHKDTNANIPLVCCPPCMTWTTCVPCLAWRRGTHFVYSNSWSRPHRNEQTRQLVLVTHCQRFPVTSNTMGNSHWLYSIWFYFHLYIRLSLNIYILRLWNIMDFWTPNAPKTLLRFPVEHDHSSEAWGPTA